MPTLEYANQPSVGKVVVDRRADGVAITVSPSWRQLSTPLAYFFLYILIAGGFTTTNLLSTSHLTNTGVFIRIGLCAMGGLLTVGGALVQAWRTYRISANPRTLSFTFRKLSDISHHEWDASRIVDVRVDRLRLKNQFRARRWVVVRFQEGRDLGILRLTEPEMEFLRDTLQEALHLPPDPLGTSEYPPGKKKWIRNRYLLAAGAGVVVQPSHPWLPAAISFIASIPLTLLTLSLISQFFSGSGHNAGPPWQVHDAGWVMPLQILVSMGFITLVGHLVIHSMRRRSVLILSQNRLQLKETGVPPAYAEWPLDTAAGFVATPVARGRTAVQLLLRENEPIELIRRRDYQQLEWLATTLNVAMKRARADLQRAASSDKTPQRVAPTPGSEAETVASPTSDE